MNNVDKAVMFLALLDTMLGMLKGETVHRGDVEDALVMLNIDPAIIDAPTITAFQTVCEEFAKLQLSEDDLLFLMGEKKSASR